MNILLATRVFYPSIGGMETVTQQLAEAWIEQGHDVQIVTQTTLGEKTELEKVSVCRKPSIMQWKKLLVWSDLFVQSGISLKSLPLGLFSRKPIVFIHHNILPLPKGIKEAPTWLRRWATHLGHNIAVSETVGKRIPSTNKTVIHNPVNPGLFVENPPSGKFELLFVGRLVRNKGVDIALQALSQLPADYSLTICGDGPERKKLQKLAQKLNIQHRVSLKGWVNHNELAEIAGQAAIQLIPSRYEPFGIVALEAVACNCAIVAADTGGLPEAVGPCGILVPKNDPEALADGIKQATTRREDLLTNRDSHLKKFRIDNIANKYLSVFQNVLSDI